MPRFSQRSLDNLEGVHPDIVRVMHRAIRDFDFTVIQGVRTEEQCRVNYGKGRSMAQLRAVGIPGHYAKPFLAKVTWLRDPFGSKHCRQRDGFGHAVDCVPYPIDWNDLHRFAAMADAVKAAAKAEGIAIKWGGDWKSSKDYPHFELAL